MFTTKPEIQAAIALLENKLRRLSLGEIIGYDALAINGFDVRRRHRYLLNEARERTEKALGVCLECVNSVGIQCLPADSVPDVGLVAVRRCRSAAKRGKKRLDRVNPNSLSPKAQLRKNGYSAMLGAIALISDGRKAESIAAVAVPDRVIPPESILDMFRAPPP